VSRTVVIPPVQAPGDAAGTGRMEVLLSLVDAAGVPIPDADVGNTLLVHGLGSHVVTDTAVEIDLPTQAELADETYYRVDVRQGRDQWTRLVQIPAGVADLTWAEFLALEDPVTGGLAWVTRLLPDDPTDGQMAVWDEVSGEWIADDVPSGTAPSIDQYDIAARLAAGTGAYSGVAAGDLTEEASPAAGMFVPGWLATGELRAFDVGNWPSGGGGDVSDGDTLTTGLTFPVAGLHILDTNASHDLILSPGSDLTADRTLTLTTGDADRTLTLAGNASVSGTNTGDQDLSGYVAKATYDANTILAATADDTPAAVTVAEQTLVGRITAGNIAALSATQVRTLLNVEDAAAADQTAQEIATAIDADPTAEATLQSALGLGSAAYTDSTAYDAAGTASGAIATHESTYAHGDIATAVQPGDLGGAALLDVGTIAGTVAAGDDSRLSDARTPTAHASTHASGQSDAIKLDDLAAPDDNTDLNASASAHGLLLKLENTGAKYLRDDGTWQAVAGGAHDALTLAATLTDLLALSTQELGAVDNGADGLWGWDDSAGKATFMAAADIRAIADVDQAGTDNSTDVTLAGTPDYLTITGQEITRNAIDLTTDVTSTLPVGNGGTGVTDLANLDAASLGAGASTDGQVLTSDGAGGAAWENATGGGGAWDGDPADIDFTAGSDIGAALADTDEIIVGDASASQASKVAAMSRVKAYMQLTRVNESLTTANLTATVNALHVLTVSGMTAARSLVIPAGTAQGDRIEWVLETAAPATAGIEMVLVGDTGVTLSLLGTDRTATADSRFRYFLAGEGGALIWDATDSKWILDKTRDGRRPASARIDFDAVGNSDQALSDATWTTVLLDHSVFDSNGMVNTGSNRIDVRRTGSYVIHAEAILATSSSYGSLRAGIYNQSGVAGSSLAYGPKLYCGNDQMSSTCSAIANIDIGTTTSVKLGVRAKFVSATSDIQSSTGTFLEITEQL
jgi:hypothetical protein